MNVPNVNAAPFDACSTGIGRMRRVVLESPYAGNFIQRWLNRRYARRCMRDCLRRGESPFASHLLYTQPGVLRDTVALERRLGIEAGWRGASLPMRPSSTPIAGFLRACAPASRLRKIMAGRSNIGV